MKIQHHYIERETGEVRAELLRSDAIINLLYSVAKEKAPLMFRALTSARFSRFLGLVSYDLPLDPSGKHFLQKCGVDFSECVDPLETLDTSRKVFERRIKYWECRPMPGNIGAVVSPADSRLVLGSLAESSLLFIKEKFFHFHELLGVNKLEWISAFHEGDFAIFRLTPDKYHYNHTPVAGVVKDIYEISGRYHSCNPAAVVTMATPYSKNKRVITIIDTDVENGTGVGLVAMIEIVALMIGDIVQAYSKQAYHNPQSVKNGMFLEKGVPKSLYRPGSSTDVLLFQKARVEFAEDLVNNLHRRDVQSRFSIGFSQPLVETDLKVRSLVGTALKHK